MRPRRAVPLAVAVLLMFVAAPPAQADLFDGDCPATGEVTQPFSRWLDPLQYILAPDGGFEAGGAGWSRSGGAAVVSGNETFYVRGAGDQKSLALPAGASATSPAICSSLDKLTMRFFSRRTSGLLPLLKVEVLTTTGVDTVLVLPAGASWQPTLPLPVLAITGSFAFRFTAIGGGFRIDDVYVDPYAKR
jgi:hypothetical protein